MVEWNCGGELTEKGKTATKEMKYKHTEKEEEKHTWYNEKKNTSCTPRKNHEQIQSKKKSLSLLAYQS